MTEAEIVALVGGLPGVHVLVASEAGGAPQAAWGDTFFSHDPDGDLPPERRMPFATIVTGNQPGFDTASRLDRDGVFRVNAHVGRERFAALLGYPPAAAADRAPDFAAADTWLPHPTYAGQGWVCVVDPGPRTARDLPDALRLAHTRAVARHRGR